MKRLILALLCLVLSYPLSAQTDDKFSSNELIVKFKTHQNPDAGKVLSSKKFDIDLIDRLNTEYDIKSIRLTGNKSQGDTYMLQFNEAQPIKALIKLYEESNLFEYVEPNYIGSGHGSLQTNPNDNFYNRQWSHYNNGTFSLSNATVDADIDTDLAWDITQGDANLIVAVLDTGLKLNHPEFSGRIWTNSDEAPDGTDTDANTYIDDVNGGWDFAYNDNDPTDDHGHGTNVTGIALASANNSIGYAGVNWNSKIMVCKILDDTNFGYYSWWAEAIYYAVDNGASVINMSVGGNGASTLLEDAVNYAYSNNVSVVVSTGNQNSVIQYPARYSNAFAVGSTNPDDTRSVPFFWSTSSGSNYGPELDFVAPGNYIYGLSHTSNTNYNSYWGGTSQAAPHVAGVISLLLSIDAGITVDEIRLILEQSSEDQVGGAEDTMGWDSYFGHGRINAFQAVSSPILRVDDFDEIRNNIKIHPNPILSGDNLKIINAQKGQNVISIYNVLGQNVYRTKISVTNNSSTIRLPELNTGTYLLKITHAQKPTSSVQKLIIK